MAHSPVASRECPIKYHGLPVLSKEIVVLDVDGETPDGTK
jgi:hypothetical protein